VKANSVKDQVSVMVGHRVFLQVMDQIDHVVYNKVKHQVGRLVWRPSDWQILNSLNAQLNQYRDK
jgi:hypothetical protein